MKQTSLLDMLVDATESFPNRTALIQQQRHLSYAQLACSVAQTAKHDAMSGIRGQRIAMICDNSIEFVITLFACYVAGAQVVPISTALTNREAGEILVDCKPVAIFLAAAVKEKFSELLNAQGIGKSIAIEELVTIQQSPLLPADVAVALRAMAKSSDPAAYAVLLYTGGTTGKPKGVGLTHAQVLVNLEQRQHLVPYNEAEEIILCFMPMSHTFALHLCVHGAVYTKNTVVIMDRYHPLKVIEIIEQERVTCLPAGPTALIGILDVFKTAPTNVSSLELIISGSAPLPLQTLLDLEKTLGCVVCEGYGQTEAGSALSFNPRYGRRKPGTVGVPFPNTDMQIVDLETDEKIDSTGTAGEICARGPQVMHAYLNRPEETSTTLRNGWLHTGDIGFFDEDGYLTICDRKKDMVIVSGYNVFPREIDDVLATHPKVSQAASIGVADEYRGEVLHSFVLPSESEARPDESELHEHCKKNLAKYKWPVRIIVVDSLPKTSVGKIDKKRLRAEMTR